nr:MAG TPA: hypothetical protein [Caudoviricetes sp.]
MHNNSPSFAVLIGRNNKARGFLFALMDLQVNNVQYIISTF